MTRVYVFTNHKRGVGKSTSATNTALPMYGSDERQRILAEVERKPDPKRDERVPIERDALPSQFPKEALPEVCIFRTRFDGRQLRRGHTRPVQQVFVIAKNCLRMYVWSTRNDEGICGSLFDAAQLRLLLKY